mgnify:CR=1 FL=1
MGCIGRIVHLLWGADREYYRAFRRIFGTTPDNIELYKLALVHRSASVKVEGRSINNERLEYLGDAVLETIISDYLFIEYPNESEGFLTKTRSKIVSRQSLNGLAVKLGLDRMVIYNTTGNFAQKHLFGDCFEALMGALYLDKGYNKVNRIVINDLLPRHIDLEDLSQAENDHKSRLIEWVRRATIKMLPINFGFKRRCRNADLILCKTEITRDLIPARYRDKSVLFTDVAVEKQHSLPIAAKSKEETIEFITVGRLDAWRGFDLVIESFACVAKDDKRMHLTIVGKGSDKERLVQLVENFGLQEQVTFTGNVPMEEYYNLLSKADVVVNASLKEGAVTVSFDSMAMGKPLICLDTTGYTRYFSNEYAVIIPRTSRKEVIANIASAMKRLACNEERESIGRKAQKAGEQFLWEARGIEFRELLMKRINQQTKQSNTTNE